MQAAAAAKKIAEENGTVTACDALEATIRNR
jgi:hypothetical protein